MATKRHAATTRRAPMPPPPPPAARKYHPEKRYTTLTTGKAIRIFRELQGFSQSELAKLAGISQPALSALENDEQTLGLDRARRLAEALDVNPAVLAFPDYRPKRPKQPKAVDRRERHSEA